MQHQLDILLSFIKLEYGTASCSLNITEIAPAHRRRQRSLSGSYYISRGTNKLSPSNSCSEVTRQYYSALRILSARFVISLSLWKREASWKRSKVSPQLLANIKTSKTLSISFFSSFPCSLSPKLKSLPILQKAYVKWTSLLKKCHPESYLLLLLLLPSSQVLLYCFISSLRQAKLPSY